MRLTTDQMLAMGVRPCLLIHARQFVATLDLCWPGFANPHARAILAEVLDDPFAVLVDGSAWNPMPDLDDTIANFAALVLGINGVQIRRVA